MNKWQKVVLCLLALVIGFGTVATSCGGNKGEEQGKTAIVYGSRYGSTAQTAEWIADGMEGKADVIAVKDAQDLSSYDFIVLGSAIYSGQLHEDVQAFLSEKTAQIKERVVALFVVCGTPAELAQGYLDLYGSELEVKSNLKMVFGGRVKRESLSQEDYQDLEWYFGSIGQPFEDFDNTDESASKAFGKEILTSR